MLRRFPAGALKNAPSAPADPLGVHRARELYTGCVADSCRTHVAVQFRFAVLTKTPHHALFGRASGALRRYASVRVRDRRHRAAQRLYMT